jgi:hypothetical protein
MNLSKTALTLLNDIENRIDEETEDDFNRQWDDFLDHRFSGDIFSPVRKKISSPTVEIPHISVNDALGDYELMLISQLACVSHALSTENGVLGMRTNYGTGIMTSLFGAPIHIMPKSMDTLPLTKAVSFSRAKEILDSGIPNFYNGFGKNVLEMGEFFSEVLRHYPKIKRYVDIYHPDLQGPLDSCEMLLGSDIFYLLYDETDNVHALLRLITDTYIAFTEKWREMFPAGEISTHWCSLKYRGSVFLRDDSAMNLSPEFYREFALPYDSEIIGHFGGGGIHFCGKGDHYIDVLREIPYLTAVNMTQPEYNDMEKIFSATIERGISLLAFPASAARQLKNRNGGFFCNLHIF